MSQMTGVAATVFGRKSDPALPLLSWRFGNLTDQLNHDDDGDDDHDDDAGHPHGIPEGPRHAGRALGQHCLQQSSAAEENEDMNYVSHWFVMRDLQDLAYVGLLHPSQVATMCS